MRLTVNQRVLGSNPSRSASLERRLGVVVGPELEGIRIGEGPVLKTGGC